MLAVRAGLSPEEYWEMSTSEFLAVVKALKSSVDEIKSRHVDTLSMLRLIITMLHNQGQPRGGQKSPEQLIPFTSDVAQPKNILDEEQLLREYHGKE